MAYSTFCSMIKHLNKPGVPHIVSSLVNLKAFRRSNAYTLSHTAGIKGYLGKSPPAVATPSSTRRQVKAQSRKRNIFLDPSDNNDEELKTLYDSSRFNRDDSDDEDAFIDPQHEQQQEKPSSDNTYDGVITLPQPRGVKIKTAEFVKSSPGVSLCPPATYPEFAVIGRSNVGKSSLINMLTGRSALAMVSKTPGKTRLINHFLINGAWYLVDLPGYGYAKASKDKVLSWNEFTREYFLERETLCSVLLLIDASIPPMALDIACANWLAEAEVPFSLVYTKLDKRKKGVSSAEENIAAFEQELLQTWQHLPPSVATSSRTGVGKMALLSHIAQLRALYHANQKQVLKKVG